MYDVAVTTGPCTLVVGSTNPTKVATVRDVARVLFPRGVVEGVTVPSGVRAQPGSDAETIRGAENRSCAALGLRPGAYGIGIESGVERHAGRLFGFTWVAVRARDGATGLGCSARIEIPPAAAALLDGGIELDEAMRRLTGIDGLGRGQGAMGQLTSSHISRGDAIRQALHFAFARFTSPELYRDGP